jgi:hypothetical protein
MLTPGSTGSLDYLRFFLIISIDIAGNMKRSSNRVNSSSIKGRRAVEEYGEGPGAEAASKDPRDKNGWQKHRDVHRR